MDREMLYAYTVYQLGSFSKAAQKLYMTQPTLSTSVKKLEDRLGVSLFNRKTQPLSLTPAGEFYMQSAKKMVEIENEMESYFSERTHKRRKITFGSSSFFCAHILPRIIIKFQEQYPNYEVELTEASAPVLKEKLENGLIDLTLTAELFDSNQIESTPWITERLVLAVPATFSINKQLADFALTFEDIRSLRYLDSRFYPVQLSKFKDELFLILKSNNESYHRVLEMCKKEGFFPKIAMQIDQLLTAYYIARDGAGVTFLRENILSYVAPTDKLLFYKIDDDLTQRDLFLQYRKVDTLPTVLQAFVTFLAENRVEPL